MPPNELRKIFAENVRRYRQSLGWTQEELAEKLHVGQGYLSTLENGKKDPQLKTIALFSEVLGVEPEALLTRSHIPQLA